MATVEEMLADQIARNEKVLAQHKATVEGDGTGCPLVAFMLFASGLTASGLLGAAVYGAYNLFRMLV